MPRHLRNLAWLSFATAVLLWWLLRLPSHTRRWAPEQAELPWAEIRGDSAHVHNVRNFDWTSATEYTPNWDIRTYDLARLDSAWFVLVPLTSAWRGPAHSFVTFGFSDASYLSVSVEARREVGEEYSVLRGLFRTYELIYVLGDERDLIGRRAVFDGTPVYLYPIQAPRETIREVFVDMVERINRLRDQPEFYNTLTNNCTSNLIRHVNRVVPGRIPPSWRTVLPGYSDEMAIALGLIDSTISIDSARARYRINDRARAAFDSAGFSRRIRATAPPPAPAPTR